MTRGLLMGPFRLWAYAPTAFPDHPECVAWAVIAATAANPFIEIRTKP